MKLSASIIIASACLLDNVSAIPTGWGNLFNIKKAVCKDKFLASFLPACRDSNWTPPTPKPHYHKSCPELGPSGTATWTTTATVTVSSCQTPAAASCTSEPSWESAWTKNNCAVMGTGYNTWEQLDSLDVCDCASRCDKDSAQSCQFVDVYEEINRADGSVIYKCAMYSDIHSKASCTNVGDVNVYIGQSMTWENPSWQPPTLRGYTQVWGPVSTAMTGQDDMLATYTLDQFIPSDCQAKCDAMNGQCSFFSLYSVSSDGESLSSICDLYAQSHVASDATSSTIQDGSSVKRCYAWKKN